MKARLRVAVSLAVTVFFLWLAFRRTDWHEVAVNLRAADWPLLLLAVLISTLGIPVRALRWKVLLAPVDPRVAFRPRMAGTAVGFATNNLVPARVGELVRAVVCGRLASLPVSAVLGSMVVERVLDGLVTVALLFGAMAWPGFPSPERAAGPLAGVRTVALVLALAAAGMIVLALIPALTLRLAEGFARRLVPGRFRPGLLRMVAAFLDGLAVLRNPRLLVLSVLWAVGQWLFLALSFWAGFRAFGITQAGFLGAVFLQSAINLAVAVPSAPGFFGPFEAASTFGLGLWGVEKARAVSFTIGFHLGGFLTVTLLGLWYVWQLDLGWRDLIGAAETAEGTREMGVAGRDRPRSSGDDLRADPSSADRQTGGDDGAAMHSSSIAGPQSPGDADARRVR